MSDKTKAYKLTDDEVAFLRELLLEYDYNHIAIFETCQDLLEKLS